MRRPPGGCGCCHSNGVVGGNVICGRDNKKRECRISVEEGEISRFIYLFNDYFLLLTVGTRVRFIVVR